MQEVVLIFDIGKTNKKCFLFDLNGKIIDQYSEQFTDIADEDGFACENLARLEEWLLAQYAVLRANKAYKILAVNFAGYGASLVHTDEKGRPLTALYNYLKPFSAELKKKFLQQYFCGDENIFAANTSSPFMGMLNSGLQLFWLKHSKPAIWAKVKYSLHLPQYLSFLFTKIYCSNYTSVGCHTGLWNMKENAYQHWVIAEGIHQKLAPFVLNEKAFVNEDAVIFGCGLHDSSSALIPYLERYRQPFLLISTGTWCVNLNPFNRQPVTEAQSQKDCLQFLKHDGAPVKASRIFLGMEHEYQVKRIAAHFNIEDTFYKNILNTEPASLHINFVPSCMEGSGPQPQKQKAEWNITLFKTAEEAYLCLIEGLTLLLKEAVDLVDTAHTKLFFVDGGFASNPLFMRCLKKLFPEKNIESSGFEQATALGAFLNICPQVQKIKNEIV